MGFETIEQILKEPTIQARVSCGRKRLVWLYEEWVVLDRKPYAKANICQYSGNSLSDALENLTKET